MWTTENRASYDRRGPRYPSDVTDHEWAVVGDPIPPAKCGGNKRTADMQAVVNGVMYARRAFIGGLYGANLHAKRVDTLGQPDPVDVTLSR